MNTWALPQQRIHIVIVEVGPLGVLGYRTRKVGLGNGATGLLAKKKVGRVVPVIMAKEREHTVRSKGE